MQVLFPKKIFLITVLPTLLCGLFPFHYQGKGSNVLQLQQETQQPANHSNKMAICLEQVRVMLGRNSDLCSEKLQLPFK